MSAGQHARLLLLLALPARLLAEAPAALRSVLEPRPWRELALAGHLLALGALALVGLVLLRRRPVRRALGAAWTLGLCLELGRLALALHGSWGGPPPALRTDLALGVGSLAALLVAALPLLRRERGDAAGSPAGAVARGLRVFRLGLLGLLAASAVGYAATITGYVLHRDLWVQVSSTARGLGAVAAATAMMVGLCDYLSVEWRDVRRPARAGLALLALATLADLWQLGLTLDGAALPPFSSHEAMARASLLVGASQLTGLLALLALLGSFARLARHVDARAQARLAGRLRLAAVVLLLVLVGLRVPLSSGMLVSGVLLVSLAAVGLALAALILLLCLRLLHGLQRALGAG